MILRRLWAGIVILVFQLLLALALILSAGCATWRPVDAYTDPVHRACADLHDGTQSDPCHVLAHRGGLVTVQDVERFSREVGFENP